MGNSYHLQKKNKDKRVSVLIVGATGKLGSEIVKYAMMHPKLDVNILIRDPSKNRELVALVKAGGGKVIIGDLSKPETLKNVTQGIHTVISAVNGADEKALTEGQIALAEDSIRNGVKRFVPSDFGVDYTLIKREELLSSFVTAYKVKFEDYLNAQDPKLPLLRFYAGNIAETFFYVLGQGHSYWGEDVKHNITTYENIARLVVAAVAKPKLKGRVTYSGSNHTVKELQDIYNKVRDTNVQLKQAGSLDDLKKLTETKKNEGDNQTAGFLALLSIVYDKRSKFPKTDKRRFRKVKHTSVEDFLKESPEVKL